MLLLDDNQIKEVLEASSQEEMNDTFAQATNEQEIRRQTLNNDLIEKEIALKNRKLDFMEQMQGMRDTYARKSWFLVVSWSVFVVILTGLQFCKPYDNMQLHKTEFISIVATALASIISLYLQVGKGVYKGIYIEKLEDI
jgi:hypothetical protein